MIHTKEIFQQWRHIHYVYYLYILLILPLSYLYDFLNHILNKLLSPYDNHMIYEVSPGKIYQIRSYRNRLGSIQFNMTVVVLPGRRKSELLLHNCCPPDELNLMKLAQIGEVKSIMITSLDELENIPLWQKQFPKIKIYCLERLVEACEEEMTISGVVEDSFQDRGISIIDLSPYTRRDEVMIQIDADQSRRALLLLECVQNNWMFYGWYYFLPFGNHGFGMTRLYYILFHRGRSLQEYLLEVVEEDDIYYSVFAHGNPIRSPQEITKYFKTLRA